MSLWIAKMDSKGRVGPHADLCRMSRVLALDYGLKRTGIAVTDPLRIIATALDTVETKGLMEYLVEYTSKEMVEGFVIGLPRNLDGTPTDGTPHVLRCITELKGRFPSMWVETVDERFTSRIAQQTLMASGKGRMARREKGQLDRISATILLQGWMQANPEGRK